MSPNDFECLQPQLVEYSGANVAFITACRFDLADAVLWLGNGQQYQELQRADAQTAPFGPRWSPQGNYLLFWRASITSNQAWLWVYETASGNLRQLASDTKLDPEFFFGRNETIAWENENTVTFSNADGQCYRVEVQTNSAAQISCQTDKVSAQSSLTYDGMEKPLPVRDYDGTCGYGSINYSTMYTGDYSCGGEGSGIHPGVDIFAPCGTVVQVIADGDIASFYNSWSGSNPCGYNTGGSWGNYLVIRHDNLPYVGEYGGTVYSIYTHLYNVNAQWNYLRGDIAGWVGSTGNSTGPHLHFQIDRANVSHHPYWPGCSWPSGACLADIYDHTWNPMRFVQAHQYPLYFNHLFVPLLMR